MGRLSTTECTYQTTYLPTLPKGPAQKMRKKMRKMRKNANCIPPPP